MVRCSIKSSNDIGIMAQNAHLHFVWSENILGSINNQIKYHHFYINDT